MTGAREARICRDRDFDHSKSLHLDQGRQKTMRTVEKFHVLDAFAFEHAIGATGIADVFADSLFRTQLAMRDEAMRIQLSPFPRVGARVPQTQSAFLSASSIVGKSLGSFCRSASSVAMYRPRATCMPAQLAADSPQLNLNRWIRRRGSFAPSCFKTLHELS